MIVLNRLPKIIAEMPVVVDAALRGAADRVAESARGRVPVESGDLRDAIHVEKDLRGWSVVAGDEKVFYGHLVEHGTVKQGAQPFLVPALEEERDVVTGGIVTALRKL